MKSKVNRKLFRGNKVVSFHNEKHNAPGSSSHDKQEIPDMRRISMVRAHSSTLSQPRLKHNIVSPDDPIPINDSFVAKKSSTFSWFDRYKEKRNKSQSKSKKSK